MIVTGCCRSGTATVAKLFDLRHEVQFNPKASFQNLKDQHIHPEASWLATPFTSVIHGHSIIHLVRSPLSVISSMAELDFWNDTVAKKYVDFIRKYLPIPSDFTDIQKSAYYWIYWNEPLESYPRIHIEDITTDIQLNQKVDVKTKQVTPEEITDAINTSGLKKEFWEKTKQYGY